MRTHCVSSSSNSGSGRRTGDFTNPFFFLVDLRSVGTGVRSISLSPKPLVSRDGPRESSVTDEVSVCSVDNCESSVASREVSGGRTTPVNGYTVGKSLYKIVNNDDLQMNT